MAKITPIQVGITNGEEAAGRINEALKTVEVDGTTITGDGINTPLSAVGGGGVTVWNPISNASSTGSNVITITDQTEFNKANKGDAVRYTITGTNAGMYRGYIYDKSAWGGTSGTYTILGAPFASGELSTLEYSDLPGIIKVERFSVLGYISIDVDITNYLGSFLGIICTNRKLSYLAGFCAIVAEVDGAATTQMSLAVNKDGVAASDSVEIVAATEITGNALHNQSTFLADDRIEITQTAPLGTALYNATDLRYIDIIMITA